MSWPAAFAVASCALAWLAKNMTALILAYRRTVRRREAAG